MTTWNDRAKIKVDVEIPTGMIRQLVRYCLKHRRQIGEAIVDLLIDGLKKDGKI